MPWNSPPPQPSLVHFLFLAKAMRDNKLYATLTALDDVVMQFL